MNFNHGKRQFVMPAALFLLTVSFGQAESLIIPQVADGGGWQTTLVLGNTTSGAQLATVKFFQDTSGGATQPWTPPFVEGGSTQNLVVPAGGTVFLHSTATAATTTTGWAQVQSAAGIVAYAIFTQRGSGRPDQDGTAAATPSVTRILMPYDNTNNFVTTMGIVNTTSAAESILVGIQPTTGTSFIGTTINLPAQGHMAFRVPDQFTGTVGQSGMLEFYVAGGSFSVLALRFNPTGSFTTAPSYSENGPPAIVPNVPINVSGVWGGQITGGKGVTGSGPSGILILAMNQSGPGVSGTFSMTKSDGTLASGQMSGSVLATALNFTGGHYFDSTGCSSQLTAGAAGITGTSIQGSMTIANDVGTACGTTAGANTFPVQFSVELAVEQYCGTYNVPSADLGVFTALVSADGSVVGSTTPTNGMGTGLTFTGREVGNTFSLTSSQNVVLNGSVSNGVLSGTFGSSGTFTASTTGCQ